MACVSLQPVFAFAGQGVWTRGLERALFCLWDKTYGRTKKFRKQEDISVQSLKEVSTIIRRGGREEEGEEEKMEVSCYKHLPAIKLTLGLFKTAMETVV